MRVLLLGGTGLSGPFIARELQNRGHEVVVYHRGEHESPFMPDCEHIHGDRKDRDAFGEALKKIKANAVIDMLSMIDADSKPVIEAFRGRIRASVHISSGDVYADAPDFGEEPISEDAPLRDPPTYEEEPRNYDKVLMERAVLAACQEGDFPATVIRYPVIYGPGRSGGYREWPIIRRVLDGRDRLALPGKAFRIPAARGYNKNLAASVVSALETDAAVGKAYNLSDMECQTLPEIAEEISKILGHEWEVVEIPDDVWEGDIYSGPLGQYDLSRASRDLGLRDVVAVKEALRETVLWQVENPPEPNEIWKITVDEEAYQTEDRLLLRIGGTAR